MTGIHARAPEALVMEMAAELGSPAPALREALEHALLPEIWHLETEYTAVSMLHDISASTIKRFLRGIAGNKESLSDDSVKDFLSNVIGRVKLDPATL